ncbi:phage/plasmid primase, P4 family [Xanthobacteraceae bacterium Astr-EGSB]|uniref:phage/plasmid primase, P4 family n=1 Tax=Astrobacterium formosum TaxID=3069710 RepID=UPI0027AE508B|nr:phage/plasmid primase, P4 family [Xanthobacteraceae bacterium Astr-EGSB]
MANELLDAALAYAARGWPVFPCNPKNKRPLVVGDRDGHGEPIPNTGGVKKASTDPDAIREWWTKWPKAMIAVAVGAPVGAFVVDYDVCTDEETGEVFTIEGLVDDVAREIGERLTDDTVTMISPRGGRHSWYAPPAGEYPKNSVGGNAGIVDHVDIRSTGGYVIVPPSMRADGRRYQWARAPFETPIAAAPAALMDRLLHRGKWQKETRLAAPQAPLRSSSPRAAGAGDAVEEAVRKYALAALDDELRIVAGAVPGTRNNTLNTSALKLGHLVGAGALSEGAVKAALIDVAEAWPDLPKSIKTIESGLAKGRSEPADLAHVREGAAERASRRAYYGSLPPPPAPPVVGGPRAPIGGEAFNSPPPPDFGAEWTGDDEDGNAPEAVGESERDEVSPAVLQRCAEEPQNDTGNGRRLLAHFGDDMLHVREVGWFVWNGTHWQSEGGDEAVLRFAQRTAERIALEADHLAASPREAKAIQEGEAAAEELTRLEARKSEWKPDDKARAANMMRAKEMGEEARSAVIGRRVGRRKYAISSGNSGKLNGMIEQALPHNTVGPEALDEDALKFNCRNGTLVFSRRRDPECSDVSGHVELKPHTRSDLISKLAPVDYDPTAKCPRFTAFIERFQPSEEMRLFLQVWLGYCMTGLTGEQSLVFFHGLGANGKSTLIEAICRLLGNYALTLSFESLAGETGRRGDQATPDLARLPGARLVRASEPERGVQFKEALLKSLTGGEPMLARHLHARFFEFRPIFKLVLSGNHKPEIGGVDHGIWRRMRLVPWNVTLSNEEMRPQEEVLGEFKEEGAGILNWLVAGVLHYLEQGLKVPQEIIDATAEYREDMDPIGGFARDCVERVPFVEGQEGKRATVTAREMYEAFVAWCEANAVRPWKEKSFGLAMPQKGFAKTNDRVRLYLDVRLHDVPKRERRGGDDVPPPPDDREFPG